MRYIDKEKGKERRRKAYDYLVGKGIQPHLAAGVIGNLMQESYKHLDSSVENKIGAVGIAQWLGARKNSLKEFAKNSGTHYKDFDTQLEFLYSELMTTGDSWTEKGRSAFFNAKTAEEAAALFVEKFERSGEKPGDPGYDNRLRNAKSVYLQFNDHAIYGKDEKGNVVNVDPKTATDEQIALSPKVKAEFYKENFDIISAKSNTPPPADPKPVAEAKEKINEVEEEKKKEAEFIKKIIERGQPVEEVTTTGKEPEARGSVPLPIEELTPDKNEFFQFFLEDNFQEGGEVEEKKSNPKKKVVVFAEAYTYQGNKYEKEDENIPKKLLEAKALEDKYEAEFDEALGELEGGTYKVLKNESDYIDRQLRILTNRLYGAEGTEEYDQIKALHGNVYDEYVKRQHAMSDIVNKFMNSDKGKEIKGKIDKARDAFYDPDLNPTVDRVESSFIGEGKNLKDFFKRKDPNIEVEVVPFYEDTDLIKSKVEGLGEEDVIMVFGHSGNKMGGVDNEKLADLFSKAKPKNCYLGSCSFKDKIESFSSMKGKELHYRPNTPWYGVNPNADTFEEAMWGRQEDPSSIEGASTLPVIEGSSYKTKKFKSGGCHCSKL